MKKYMLLPIIIAFIVIISCEKDEFISPKASFEIWDEGAMLNEPFQLEMKKTYTFKSTGEGDRFVFWFGIPEESDYSKRGIDNAHTGETVEEEDDYMIDFAYDTTGTYQFVMVASSYDHYIEKYEEDVKDVTITVVE